MTHEGSNYVVIINFFYNKTVSWNYVYYILI